MGRRVNPNSKEGIITEVMQELGAGESERPTYRKWMEEVIVNFGLKNKFKNNRATYVFPESIRDRLKASLIVQAMTANQKITFLRHIRKYTKELKSTDGTGFNDEYSILLMDFASSTSVIWAKILIDILKKEKDEGAENKIYHEKELTTLFPILSGTGSYVALISQKLLFEWILSFPAFVVSGFINSHKEILASNPTLTEEEEIILGIINEMDREIINARNSIGNLRNLAEQVVAKYFSEEAATVFNLANHDEIDKIFEEEAWPEK